MIREINLYAKISRFSYIHPLEKIVVCLISLIYCSYTKNIYMILINSIIFFILSIIAKNPFKLIRKFLLISIIFTLTTSISLIIGGIYKDIFLIFLRGLNGSITISFLALTTPLDNIVYLLSKNRFTKDIGDIAKGMENFLMLIERDFEMTFMAMKSRGAFNGFKRGIIDTGYAVGIVFKNLIERWKDIDQGLKSRCYMGKYNYSYNFKFRIFNIIGIGIYLTFLLII